MSARHKLDWERDGGDWPNRAFSRFVEAGGLRWHVQVMGEGPVLMLVHGTAGATHFWRGLAPLLAARFTIVAPDLPGHGFTSPAPLRAMSMGGMGRGVRHLLDALDLVPVLAVGHSAGAAVVARMCLEGMLDPVGFVSVNGALLPIRGFSGPLFGSLARVLASTPVAAHLFSRRARDPAVLERLVARTGSKLDAEGMDFYTRLARTPGHIAGALRMMASWDLDELERDLPRLKTPLALVIGGADGTITPEDGFRVRDLVPGSIVDYLRNLGHLAPEEAPGEIASVIIKHAVAWNILPA